MNGPERKGQNRHGAGDKARALASRAAQRLQNLDVFGEQFQEKLDADGHNKLPTWCGAFVTVLVAIVLLSYTYQKTDVWLGRKDIEIMASV